MMTGAKASAQSSAPKGAGFVEEFVNMRAAQVAQTRNQKRESIPEVYHFLKSAKIEGTE